MHGSTDRLFWWLNLVVIHAWVHHHAIPHLGCVNHIPPLVSHLDLFILAAVSFFLHSFLVPSTTHDGPESTGHRASLAAQRALGAGSPLGARDGCSTPDASYHPAQDKPSCRRRVSVQQRASQGRRSQGPRRHGSTRRAKDHSGSTTSRRAVWHRDRECSFASRAASPPAPPSWLLDPHPPERVARDCQEGE